MHPAAAAPSAAARRSRAGRASRPAPAAAACIDSAAASARVLGEGALRPGLGAAEAIVARVEADEVDASSRRTISSSRKASRSRGGDAASRLPAPRSADRCDRNADRATAGWWRRARDGCGARRIRSSASRRKRRNAPARGLAATPHTSPPGSPRGRCGNPSSRLSAGAGSTAARLVHVCRGT